MSLFTINLVKGCRLIFQKQIPYDTTYPKLPGTRPISPDEWLICDDAFAQQMALRDELIDTKKDKVLAISEEAREAAVELAKMTLDFCISKLGYKKKYNKISKLNINKYYLQKPVKKEKVFSKQKGF